MPFSSLACRVPSGSFKRLVDLKSVIGDGTLQRRVDQRFQSPSLYYCLMIAINDSKSPFSASLMGQIPEPSPHPFLLYACPKLGGIYTTVIRFWLSQYPRLSVSRTQPMFRLYHHFCFALPRNDKLGTVRVASFRRDTISSPLTFSES